MKSFGTMVVGHTKSMRHSRKLSGPMIRRAKLRSWRPKNRRNRGRQLLSLMKTKKAIGIRKNLRQMIGRRRTSRVEGSVAAARLLVNRLYSAPRGICDETRVAQL